MTERTNYPEGNMTYSFYSTCVDFPPDEVFTADGLCNMIDVSIDITRRTFLSHVDRIELEMLERNLGYASHWTRGLVMNADYHVIYSRSTLRGQRVYFFTHSAIEHIFTNNKED